MQERHKKWEKLKNEKYKISLKRNNDNKILHFYFLYMEEDIFCSKTIVWKYVVYTITFLVKIFHLKRSNETPTSI